MQRDAVYLADILSAAADLREFTRAASLEESCSNKTLRYVRAGVGGTSGGHLPCGVSRS
jgi:uncharacterized protein with HEPN domain